MDRGQTHRVRDGIADLALGAFRPRRDCARPVRLGALAALALQACTVAGSPDAGGAFDAGRDSGPRADACIPGSCRDAPASDAAHDAPACAAVRAEPGERIAPLDVVWNIQSTGGLEEEMRLVEANLLDFANTLRGSSLDYHLIVIASAEGAGGFRLPPELASDPRFRHVDFTTSGLGATWTQLSRYQDFLRPDGIMHVISVSDNASGHRREASFWRTYFDIYFDDYVVHVVASPPGSGSCEPAVDPCTSTSPEWVEGCVGPYGKAQYNGDGYWAFSASTGGLQLSLCTEDWSALFGAIASRVTVPVPVPCELTLPEPPDGTVLDPARVNVELTPGGGAPVETIPSVASASECPEDGDAWHYDDPLEPRAILLCPRTCERVETDPEAELDLAFGCLTVPF